MFEEHIHDILQRCIAWSIGAKDAILLRDISAGHLPASIRRYFELEAEVWLADEKRRLVDAAHFRYDDDRVRAHFDAIIDIAPDYAVFERADFLALLDTAVKLQFNYACRPEWTLARYVFADTDHASADTILRAMSAFTDYTYFHSVLAEYFERRSVEFLHRDRYAELLALIDDELVRGADAPALANLAEPLFRLFSPDGEPEHTRIPIDALVIFFDDKRLRLVVDRLDQERGVQKDLSLHGLAILLQEVDFNAGADISELVSRHMTGEAAAPAPSVPYEVTSPADETALPPDILAMSEPGTADAFVDAGYPAAGMTDAFVDAGAGISFTGDAAPEDASTTPVFETMEFAETATGEDAWLAPSGYEALETDDVGLPVTGFDESTFVFDRNTPVIPLDDAALADDAALTDDAVLAGEQVTPSFDDEYLLPDGIAAAAGTADTDDADAFALPAELASDVSPTGAADDLLDLTDLESILAGTALTDTTAAASSEPDVAAADLSLPDFEVPEDSPAPGAPAEASAAVDPFLDELNLSDDDVLPQAPSAAKQPAHDLDEIPDFEIPDEAGETVASAAAESVPAQPAPLFAPPGGDMFATTAPVEEVIAQLGDMRTRIAAGDRKKYVKKIFNRDEAAYEQAIDAINARSTWREASELIDEVFMRFNIDMYSRIAVKFTDDIYRRYSQNKG